MRRNFILLIGLIFALIFTYNGCKHEAGEYILPPGDTICDTSNVTYNGTVYPIFNEHCIFCHNSTDLTGGLDLTNYELVAYEASSGNLITRLTATDTTRMPKNGNALSDCEIRKIEIWIRDTTFIKTMTVPAPLSAIPTSEGKKTKEIKK